MPYSPRDAIHHTRRATTGHLKRLWANVANSVYRRTHSGKRAIRAGDMAVRNDTRRRVNAIIRKRKHKLI